MHVVGAVTAYPATDRGDDAPERSRGEYGRLPAFDTMEPAGRARGRRGVRRTRWNTADPARGALGSRRSTITAVEASRGTARRVQLMASSITTRTRVNQRTGVGRRAGWCAPVRWTRTEFHLHDLLGCRVGAAVRGLSRQPGRRHRAPAPNARHRRSPGDQAGVAVFVAGAEP